MATKNKGSKWIQKAIKHPGALRKKAGVKEGQNIPVKTLNKLAKSKDTTTARQARLAKTLRKLAKRKK